MRKLLKKIKSVKGESFVEILIAVLIVAFGCLFVATMYSSSMNINITAKQKDDSYYQSLSDMESGTANGKELEVTITEKNDSEQDGKINVTVDQYGNEDTSSYRIKE